jgi:hypothetical protein
MTGAVPVVLVVLVVFGFEKSMLPKRRRIDGNHQGYWDI